MLLVHTKSLTHLEDTFTKFFANYEYQNQQPPIIFFTDNVLGDQAFLEKYLPSLKTDVQHVLIPKAADDMTMLPLLKIPANVKISMLTTKNEMNDMATLIMNDLGTDFVNGECDEPNPVYLGFDIEWVASENGQWVTGRKTALIQIAYKKDVFLLRLCALPRPTRDQHVLPSRLIQLLKCPQVFKIGKNVGGDLRRLSKDFEIGIAGALELSKFCFDRGVIKSTSLSLQRICEECLGHSLQKEAGLRCEGWEDEVLLQEKIDYAALDAWYWTKRCHLFFLQKFACCLWYR
ncbi:hypothetical protein [Parasitella parasitica]|uniref:3'-5' exonuclease domain-containing protein n=1 Tax=Parasitella parasitica TaxID=35722 RepID=A0A0B7MVX1_9FUNG|nr:hypothetical protein [Parasitella parasitica]